MSELLCPICGKNVQSVNVTPDCQHTSREIFEYIYSIKAELDKIKADLKQMGDYTDDLFADCATFLNERDALRKNLDIAVEAIKQFLERMEDEKDTSMDTTLYVIDGLRDALAEIEKIGG